MATASAGRLGISICCVKGPRPVIATSRAMEGRGPVGAAPCAEAGLGGFGGSGWAGDVTRRV